MHRRAGPRKKRREKKKRATLTRRFCFVRQSVALEKANIKRGMGDDSDKMLQFVIAKSKQ